MVEFRRGRHQAGFFFNGSPIDHSPEGSAPRDSVPGGWNASRALARPVSVKNAPDLAVLREIIPNAQKITQDQTLVGKLRGKCNEGPRRRRRLDRKVAILSGGGAAGDGIGNGRAAAILLARAGTKVLVADLDKKLADGPSK